MRTLDAPTLALLTGPVRRYVHRVELENADADWIDVTGMFLGFTWSEDRDAGAATGTLRLRREVFGGPTAPLAADDFNDGAAVAAQWSGGGDAFRPAWGNISPGQGALSQGVGNKSELTAVAGSSYVERTFTGLPPSQLVRVFLTVTVGYVLGVGPWRDPLFGLEIDGQRAGWRIGDAAPTAPVALVAQTTASGTLTVRVGALDYDYALGSEYLGVRQIVLDDLEIWAFGTRPSLAPLVADSVYNVIDGEYSPLANPFHGMRASAAVYAPADEPSRDDAEAWETWYAGLVFREVFRGVIDDPSWGGRGSVIELAVRDLAAPLQDAQILDARPYGSPIQSDGTGGTPIEDVLQQILVDNGFVERGDGSLTVEVLGDTEGWSLGPFAQALGVSVWDACRTLAIQMGWDFRYWRHADDTYRPTLLKPRRDTATVDLAPTTAMFTDIPKVRLNGTDVRNDGRLTYRDVATGQLATVYAQNAGSIAAFGGPNGIPRSFGIPVEATANIDTEAEAQQMLDAAVADLATPYVEQDVVLPYCWPIQLGDVLQFPETTVFADDVLRFGVVSVHHEIAPESAKCTTTVSLRGRPIGAYQRWLDLLGLRATTDTTPRPIIGPLLGDGAPDGGTTGEAGCWLPVTYEKKTDGVEVFVEAGLTSPVALPLLDDASRAYIARRHEGAAQQAAAARTVLFLAMWPDYYEKTYTRPFGTTGGAQVLGVPVAHEAQAVIGFAATLGAITTFDVTRSADGTGNTLTWTAAGCSSPYAVELFVWRNGEVIDRIPWTSTGTYDDTALPVDREYQYDLQAWTNDGVAFARSGPRARTTQGAPTPAGSRVPTVFANLVTTGAGYPGVGVSVVPGTGVTDVLVVEQAVDSGGVTGTWGTLREYPYDGTTAPAFTDLGVVAGRTYRYRAYARTAGLADSATSAEADVTIPLTAGIPALDATLSADGDPPAITLLVTPPTGADTITVYRARSSLSFALLSAGTAVDTGSTETAIVDDAIVGGKTYRYYVTTTQGGVESAPSSTVTRVAPMPP